MVAKSPAIAFVDLERRHQEIGAEIERQVVDVLRSGIYVGGPQVDAFEKEFAKYCGTEFAVSTNSGTAALHLALLALGVGAGDEVITVSHTFVATAEAIVAAGATPVFVDIDPKTYCMDPKLLEAAITAKTRAILPVHLYGHPAAMDAISRIAREHGIPVVEDACQAHGATLAGRTCGSLGAVGCFSFYPSKNLGSVGEGGIAVTDSAELARHMRQVRDHGQSSRYHHASMGYNYRLPSIQAAALRVGLGYLDQWNQRRREIAAQYSSLLAAVDVGLPTEAETAQAVYHLYVIRAKHRDQLLTHLAEASVSTAVHYPVPIHRQPPYERFTQGQHLPATDAAAAEILSLPMHPYLRAEEVEHICTQIAAFAGRR